MNGGNKRFALALAEPRINQGEDEDLTKALRRAMVLVGLRAQNFPDDFETKILKEFIFEHYGGHTPAEIRLAFEMAITGKLDMEMKDVKCYENFSVAYFASIMEAYRSWAREQIKLLPAPAEVIRVPTAEERRELDFEYAHYMLSVLRGSLNNKLPLRYETGT